MTTTKHGLEAAKKRAEKYEQTHAPVDSEPVISRSMVRRLATEMGWAPKAVKKGAEPVALEFEALLAKFQEEVWAAAQEDSRVDYDLAGIETAKKLIAAYNAPTSEWNEEEFAELIGKIEDWGNSRADTSADELTRRYELMWEALRALKREPR